MPNKSAHSFEELKSQQSKMDTTDEEVLEQKPDRDALEKWASDVLFKLEEIHDNVREIHDDVTEIHDDVREIQGELEEVKGQVDSIESADWP